MLTFNVTTAGQSLLNAATPGSNPVLIDSIVLSGTGSFSSVSPVTNFAGAVVAADSDVGDYTVANNSYTIQQISLKSGNTVLANSEAVSITKVSGKPACFRISCQYAGANKCAFQNTNINIPYASKTRDGVIRLAVSSDETHKDRTVYSAADVEALIAAGVDGSDKYVPWNLDTVGEPIGGVTTVSQISVVTDYGAPSHTSVDTINIYAELNESENDVRLVVDHPIYGDAVTDSPTYTDTEIQGGYGLINENYISALYSNTVLDNSDVATNKLVSGSAVDTYVTNKLASIDGNYVHIAGTETVTGAKTFSAAAVFSTSVSSPSYIGTGVYSTYAANTWSNSSNNAKLPTVAAVRGAIGAAETSITSAYQTADSGLQSQIDALNAGQNLADIVATKSALDALSITNLQAGDKVQVLADETHDGASTVYNLTSTSPKTWTYIGKYGQDSYTKSEADNLFVENSQIKQSVDSTKQDEIPSSSAVASYVSTAISTASGDYVKLSSQTEQSITSDLDITGDVDITGSLDIDNVSINGFEITGSYINTSGNPYSYRLTTGSPGESSFYIQQRSGNSTVASITLNGPGHASINNGVHSIYFDSTSDNQSVPDVGGTLVANYASVPGGTLSDGRLVTVDYLSSYTGDMSAYVKKTSSTAQNISSDLSITGDVDITGSLDVDNVSIDSTTVTTSWVACGGQTFSGSVGSSGGYSYGLSLNSGYSNTNIELTFRDLGTPSAELSVGSNNIEFYSSNSSPVVRGSYVADYNDFQGASLEDGRLTTVDYVKNSIKDISSENAVGSIGLFLYTEVGNQKSYGEFVNGAYLKPVGMSLPISGQISYKAVATNEALSGKWKLLSVAMKRTATEPCLVLAQKVDVNYSNS